MQSIVRPRGASILIVDDDPAVALTLTEALQLRGHHLRHAMNGAEAWQMIEQARPDLIILDLMLPDADGLVLCADLKARLDVPILVCSASPERRDRILALKLGADDFVGKPFDLDELEARVESLLRRVAQRQQVADVANDVARSSQPSQPPREQILLGDLVVDHLRRHATLGGAPLQLTPTEYRLLRALASRPNEVLSRQDLAQQVWGYHEAGNGRAVDVHVGRLRAKLTRNATLSPAIVSVRGFGYKLVWEGCDGATAGATWTAESETSGTSGPTETGAGAAA